MIKRMILILGAVLAVLLAAGCGTSQSAAPGDGSSGIQPAAANTSQPASSKSDGNAGSNGKRILVVYFS